MGDPFGIHQSRAGTSYADWLWLCERWMDEKCAEELRDYPHFPWEQWYAAGHTVDEAVRLAHRELYGSDAPW